MSPQQRWERSGAQAKLERTGPEVIGLEREVNTDTDVIPNHSGPTAHSPGPVSYTALGYFYLGGRGILKICIFYRENSQYSRWPVQICSPFTIPFKDVKYTQVGPQQSLYREIRTHAVDFHKYFIFFTIVIFNI